MSSDATRGEGGEDRDETIFLEQRTNRRRRAHRDQRQVRVLGGEGQVHPHRVYALSDVENDDPRVISSGPFTRADVEFHVIGNNFSFRQLLKSALEERGLDVINMQAFESGDAATLISKIRQLFADNAHNPNCPIILSGGEVPIQVTGNGKGGRCTHLALSMAPVLAQYKDALFVAYATDGSDNLSDVAGAWVDAATG